MSEPTTAIQTIDGQVLAERPAQMIRPLATPDEAYDNFQAFQALKQRLVTEDDRITSAGKTYVKKSGWRKIAAAFGISLECVAEEREDLPGVGFGFLWRVRVRATAPNGRYAEGTAGCASNERKFSHVEHDVYAQAYTRACNRAISDLVGGGEVSAEEMKADPRPALTPKAAAEMLSQFERSCEQQHIDWAWFELAGELMCNGGDLRRAFKALKTASEHQGRDAEAEEVERLEPEDE